MLQKQSHRNSLRKFWKILRVFQEGKNKRITFMFLLIFHQLCFKLNEFHSKCVKNMLEIRYQRYASCFASPFLSPNISMAFWKFTYQSWNKLHCTTHAFTQSIFSFVRTFWRHNGLSWWPFHTASRYFCRRIHLFTNSFLTGAQMEIFPGHLKLIIPEIIPEIILKLENFVMLSIISMEENISMSCFSNLKNFTQKI